MAQIAALPYPTLVPTAVPNSGQASGSGGPTAKTVVHWSQQFSDKSIRGALKINPAYAGDMFAGKYLDQHPSTNRVNSPLEVKSLPVAQAEATEQGPNAWKKRTLGPQSNNVRFGVNPPQKPTPVPWSKKFIPPLALYNDASQWVNRLMFNRPMTPWGGGDSDPPLKAQYFTPPPIGTNNLAAGTMNTQLQLGMLTIQAQQLTISASNYYGGS